jgi:hypothetical protein
MTHAEAMQEVRGLAAAGRVRFVGHARKRMGERGARVLDVVHALANATDCRAADEPGRWRATGPDRDGDELTAIVEIDNGVLVITIY